MEEYIIEFIFGLIAGGFLGVTGIAPYGLLLVIFEYLKIGNYMSTLGTLIFLNLFPISIGSFYEFWKAKQINFKMGIILLISTILGSTITTKFVLKKANPLSKKTLKYITALLGFLIFIVFTSAAYNEKP